MRNLTRLRDRYDLDATTVIVECPCLLQRAYDGLSALEADGGAIANETPLLVRCPRCERVYSADASYDDNQTPEWTIPEAPALTLTLASGDREPPVLPIGSCTACNAEVYAEDYYEGHGHPEIGWEYYECPECKTGMSPRHAEFDDIRTPDVRHTEEGT
jgi:hypothetical protein